MRRGAPVCLILDGGKLSLVRGGSAAPELLAVTDSVAALATPSPQSARDLATEIIAALGDTRPATVVLGLPSTWLDHAVLALPTLSKLDRLAYVQREITKRGVIPADDMLFSIAAGTVVRRRSRAQDAVPSRLVIAAKESPVATLLAELELARVRVTYVGSPAATAMLNTLTDGTRGGAPPAEPWISLEIRDSGFAIAVSMGIDIHQFRMVTVALPRDLSTLAQVVAEEVRRSTIFFREKHRGKDVTRIRLFGRLEGDAEELRSRVAESTSITTEIVGSMSETGDVLLEAQALLADATSKHSLDLLPVEGFRARRSWFAVAPVAALVAVFCAGLVGVSKRIDQNSSAADAHSAGFISPDLAATTGAERSDFQIRLDRLELERDALRAIEALRLDVPFLLGAVGSALDANCQLVRATFSSPAAGRRSIRLEGRFVGSYWDCEPRLDAWIRTVSDRTRFRFFVPPDGRPERGELYQEFVAVSLLEPIDESARP